MGTVLVFIFNEMTDYEVTLISHLLYADAGINIETVSYVDEIVKGKSGFMYKPSKILSEINIDDIEGIIIPGGWELKIKPDLLELINTLNNRGKLVAGICGAGTIALACADVLKNVKYTTIITEWTDRHVINFGIEDPFPRNNYINKRVVRDKNIITAEGIAFVDFAIEICDYFKLFDNNKEKLAFRDSI